MRKLACTSAEVIFGETYLKLVQTSLKYILSLRRMKYNLFKLYVIILVYAYTLMNIGLINIFILYDYLSACDYLVNKVTMFNLAT